MRRFRVLTITLAAAGIICPAAAAARGADLVGSAEVSGRPAQHAVVWLTGNAAPAETPQKAVLDQRNLAFFPHVLAVRLGTTVEFPNNDKVFHNVFSFRDGKKFDLGMYPKGVVKRIVFDEPGLARLFCNIHPNMAAYVIAVDSAYFAVSDESGTFTISGVPPGTYTYHAWRPGAQTLTGSISVDGHTPLDIRW
jgi:plastocyanin